MKDPEVRQLIMERVAERDQFLKESLDPPKYCLPNKVAQCFFEPNANPVETEEFIDEAYYEYEAESMTEAVCFE